ncbi:hypothetical protein [Aureimonas sp. N4]|uniref:hypothetical protein n=1 Tax=Aureimonas sp. N4 TaxID=1638165 RepID=UPI000785A586|nr:hypothetical protein [Aureimonas sp. N4]
MASNSLNPLLDDEPGEHAPLSLRYDTKPYRAELQREFDTTPAGAAILVALTREAEGTGRDTSVSLNKAKYPSGGGLFTFSKVPPAVKKLAADELIDFWKQESGVRDMQSVMRARPETVAIVRRILDAGPPIRVIPPRDTVVLRRNGVEERAPDTRAVNRQRKRIEHLNADLACAGLSIGDSSYTRMFVGDMKSCGRLIAEGGAWQNVEKGIRRAATLRGKALSEWDYSTTHPSILYSTVGLVPPSDSYDIDACERKLAKAVFNVLVNASDYWQAVGAVAHSKAMAKTTSDEKEAVRIARAAIAEMKRKHAPIRRFFETGAGLWLMYVESEMAMDVLDLVRRDDQVAFCLHDGHLVEASYGGRLGEHMRAVADRHGYASMGVEEKTSKPSEAVSGAAHEHEGNQSVRSEMDYRGESAVSLVAGGFSSVTSFTAGSDSSTVASAASRRGEAEALRTEAEGRSPSPESSAPISDAAAEAPTFDSIVDPSEDAPAFESPAGSLDVASCAPSSVHATSHSLPWDRSSILASLDLRRHARAVAAARAVAGPAVSPDIDWSPTIGFGLAQSTDRGATWTWSLPGRRETVVHVWNAAGETVLAVADQAAAGRVVEAYLRSLAGAGPRLRIDVGYAGRYDLSRTFEDNAALYEPVSDVLLRPSLVPGAPANDDEEPPFSTDESWFDDDDLPLAA